MPTTTKTTAGRTAQYWLTTFNSGNPANVAGESELTPRVFLKDSANFNGQPTGGLHLLAGTSGDLEQDPVPHPAGPPGEAPDLPRQGDSR